MVHPAQAPGSDIESVLAACEGGPGPHLVQFYEEGQYLIEVVGKFVREGLLRGEPTVLVTTKAHRTDLIQSLSDLELDVESALDRERLIFLDAREVLAQILVDGMPDGERFHAFAAPMFEKLEALHPGANVRAYGEMVDLLWEDGHPEAALELEALWNALGQSHNFALLCTYGLKNFTTGEDADRFASVCRAHSHVIPSEGYCKIESDDVRLRRISELEQRAKALEHEVEQRKRVERELLEAVRVREDFLAVAGHELKTPLTAMQLQMDRLLSVANGHNETEIAGRVTRLRKQTGRLGSLVEDLLDVSRLSAGRFKLEPEQMDLAAVVREVADRFAESAARSGCNLRVFAEEPVAGEWDRLRVEQVVTNLLSNALKYGAGKPIEIVVAATKTRARLVVRDCGEGIPLRDQARIFQRFDRASASRNYGGLGLGLWIVRQLVEAHGGTVRVESEPQEGAAFLIELPRSFES